MAPLCESVILVMAPLQISFFFDTFLILNSFLILFRLVNCVIWQGSYVLDMNVVSRIQRWDRFLEQYIKLVACLNHIASFVETWTHKLESYAQISCFIGYCADHKKYHCWDPISCCPRNCPDVMFWEHRSYFLHYPPSRFPPLNHPFLIHSSSSFPGISWLSSFMHLLNRQN